MLLDEPQAKMEFTELKEFCPLLTIWEQKTQGFQEPEVSDWLETYLHPAMKEQGFDDILTPEEGIGLCEAVFKRMHIPPFKVGFTDREVDGANLMIDLDKAMYVQDNIASAWVLSHGMAHVFTRLHSLVPANVPWCDGLPELASLHGAVFMNTWIRIIDMMFGDVPQTDYMTMEEEAFKRNILVCAQGIMDTIVRNTAEYYGFLKPRAKAKSPIVVSNSMQDAKQFAAISNLIRK